MKALLKLFFLFIFLTQFTFASKMNLLYDSQNDGSIDPNSVWVVQMIKEAGRINGIDINFQGGPWSRALQLVKDGFAHGVINASYDKDRAKYAVYPMINGKLDKSKSLKAPAYYLYKRKDSNFDFDGKKLINAKGYIGAIPSYAVIKDLKKLNAKVQYKTNVISNLNSVLYKEFLATAQLASEADVVINENKELKKNIVKLSVPIRKKEYYLIFSKNYYKQNQAKVHKIWNTIEKLKNKKKYLNINKEANEKN